MKKPILISAVVALLAAGGGVAYAGGNHSNEPSAVQSRATAFTDTMSWPDESSYVPVTPCRLVNTKLAGGRITSGHTRGFSARSTDLSGQGGQAGGCGIPSSAVAVSITVTAFAATGPGNLVAYPGNLQTPATRTVSYRKGSAASAGTITQLSPAGGSDFLIWVSHSTQVWVDVTGYYVPPMAAFVQIDGTLQFATSRVTASSHPSTGNYLVTFDRDVSKCSFVVTPYAYNWVVAVGPQFGNIYQAHVYIHDQTGTQDPHDTSFFIQAVC